MSDEPPTPSTANASIGDHNTISDSPVNLTSIDQRGQQVGTQYNAAGNITVTPWQPRWEPSAAEAQALLDAMPRDHIPEISPMPSFSRMPFAPNPHFVGRDDVLLVLATALHGGAPVARACSICIPLGHRTAGAAQVLPIDHALPRVRVKWLS